MRVIVVGAGIVGGSIAFHVARREAEVTLIDAGRPGHGASRVSFAWINARDKDPREYHDLNRRSQEMWRRFEERLDADVGLVWGGELRWSVTEVGGEELRARVAELQSWGYSIRSLSAAEAHELEPGIRFGDVTGVSYTDSDGHVNPVAVAEACAARVAEMGGDVITGAPVEEIVVARGLVQSVVAGGREYVGDAFVIACGASTPELARMAGIELGDQSSFGATVVTSVADGSIFQNIAAMHTPRDLPESLLNIRQFTDGRVMIHGGQHGGADREGSRDDAEAMLAEAVRWLPLLEGVEVEELRTATRPVPADGLPVLGFTHAAPNLYLAFMHSGVSLAPLVGEFAALEIVDGARVDLLAPYRVERFG